MKYLYKILLLLTISFSARFAFCQDFEVSPVIVSFDANPGEIQEKFVHVKNYDNKVQTFSANLYDFSVENGKKIKKKLGSTNRSLVEVLNITPTFFELNPNQSIDIKLILTVPPKNFSTHWGYLDIGPAKEQKSYEVDKQRLTTGINIVSKIEILINQSPRSNKNYKCEILKFVEISSNNDEIRLFKVVIKNSGGMILKPHVHLEYGIYETAELVKFGSKEKTIYPDEIIEFELEISKNNITSSGQLAVILDYGHDTQIEGAVLEISP